MTAEKDPRIEAVAKLLFTGPLSGLQSSSWDDSYWEEMRHDCLMAAEDVLRGIDEAAVCETVADLDALPSGAIVRGRTGVAYEQQITNGHAYWLEAGNEMSTFSSLIELPAQILWVPKE